MKSFFLIFCVSIGSISWAQIGNVQGLGNEVMRTRKYDDVKGSPYLYQNWNSGALIDNTGKVVSNVLLKYDTYKDKVEVNKEGVIMEMDAALYPKFTFNFADAATNEVVKHFFVSGLSIPGYSKTGYFDLVYDGKWKLMKKYKTFLNEGNVQGYGTSDQQKEFQSKAMYFFTDDKGSIQEVKLSKKSIVDAYPDRAIQIEAFLKESKSKVKTERDLISIVKFLEK